MAGAKLIEWANQINTENMEDKPTDLAAMFDPPFTTLHVGMIKGGTAHNITAKDCWFAMDFRVVPGEDKDKWAMDYLKKVRAVEAEMQAVVPETRIEITPRFDVPALQPEHEGEAEALVRQITGDNASHKVSYGTEAGQFQDAGYSAVICGPGSIEQAHQPNEYIEVAQFNAGHDFMKKLLERLAT
jgi:acetylornithine deacetylase